MNQDFSEFEKPLTTTQIKERMGGALCRGSWLRGSACGKCARCRDEAVRLLPGFIKQSEERLALLTALVAVIIPLPSVLGCAISDEFKVKCFEEARRIIAQVYGEDK